MKLTEFGLIICKNYYFVAKCLICLPYRIKIHNLVLRVQRHTKLTMTDFVLSAFVHGVAIQSNSYVYDPDLSGSQAKISYSRRWMLRIVDVSKALEKRGYPQGTEAELHLEIRDNLLAENNGMFVLTVANYSGEVTKGGKGELQLEISSL